MFTAVAVVDFVATKLALDAAGRVSDPQQLTSVLRFVLIGGFVALAGMAVQIERRNRLDRIVYLTNEDRALAALRGDDPASVQGHAETPWRSVRQSWATTWPLVGLAGLTAALCWFAGLIGNPAPKATTTSSCVTTPAKPSQPPGHPPNTGK
jgi:hypothetical protein